jgi:hypothetical protein
VNPAIRTEAGAFIEHIAGNGGRIDVADPRLTARRVSLTQLPTGWNEESRDVAKRFLEFVRWSRSPDLRQRAIDKIAEVDAKIADLAAIRDALVEVVDAEPVRTPV